MRRLHFVLTKPYFSKNKVQDQNSSANEALRVFFVFFYARQRAETQQMFFTLSLKQRCGEFQSIRSCC